MTMENMDNNIKIDYLDEGRLLDFENSLEDYKIRLLASLEDSENGTFLGGALEEFSKICDRADEHEMSGFNEWLIHDFKNDEGSLINQSLITVNENIRKAMVSSYLSFFDVIQLGEKTIFKDIFDKTDYVVLNSENIDSSGIVFARLYPYGKSFVMSNEFTVYSNEMRKTIVGMVSNKFNESREALSYQYVSEFIKGNPIVLYAIVNIFDDIEKEEQEQEELYSVIALRYACEDKEPIMEIVSSDNSFSKLYEDIYQYSIGERVIMEMVFENATIEFEFVSQEDREIGQGIIEKLFGSKIRFLTEQIIEFDELI